MKRLACFLALLPAPAMAVPQLADSCKESPRPPEPWTSWNQSGDAIAGGEPGSAPRLILGKPVAAVLRPAVQVQFPAKPGKTQPKTYGGLFTLALKDAARIGIGLSGPAWIDVVAGRRAATSVDHGHGPECSGIRKIVWFDLPMGVHIVQISNAPGRQIRVMAADARANRPPPPVRDKAL